MDHRIVQRLALLLVLMAPGPAASAAALVSGVVRSTLGDPIAGARVALAGGNLETETAADGAYRLAVPPGDRAFEVSHPGHVTLRRSLSVSEDVAGFELRLEPLYRLSEARGRAGHPGRRQGARDQEGHRPGRDRSADYGQEMPFLLRAGPVPRTSTPTRAAAPGYTYLYLRGIQQTRINMTLDGVPLSEPEDSTALLRGLRGLREQRREHPDPARGRDLDGRRRLLRGLDQLRERRHGRGTRVAARDARGGLLRLDPRAAWRSSRAAWARASPSTAEARTRTPTASATTRE